jgi:hypothetical protein
VSLTYLSESGGQFVVSVPQFTTGLEFSTVVADGHKLTDGATITGSGDTEFFGGKLSVTGQVSIDHFKQTGTPTLSVVGGTLTLKGSSSLAGGTLVGGGSTVVNPNVTLDLNGNVTFKQALVNNGTLNWNNTDLTFSDGGSLTNNGVMEIWGQNTMTDTSAATPAAFANNGTVHANNFGGPTTIQVPFTNAGTLNMVAGAQYTFTKDVVQTGGQTLLNGKLQTAGKFDIQGGIVEAQAASTIIATNGVFNSGTIRMSGGACVLTVTGDLTQNAGGRYEARLIGAAFDQINVSGKFTMGGTLKAYFVGTPPANATAYKVAKYGSKANAFATTDLPASSTWTPGNTEGNVFYSP